MKHTPSKYAHLIKLLSAALLALPCAVATAADNDATVAYVDSVLKWGAWELDIEPAAGGLQASKTRPLNARNSKVSLRTNSMSALAPHQKTGAGPGLATPTLTPVPSPPVAPAPSPPALPAAPTAPAPPGSTPPTVVTLP